MKEFYERKTLFIVSISLKRPAIKKSKNKKKGKRKQRTKKEKETEEQDGAKLSVSFH